MPLICLNLERSSILERSASAGQSVDGDPPVAGKSRAPAIVARPVKHSVSPHKTRTPRLLRRAAIGGARNGDGGSAGNESGEKEEAAMHRQARTRPPVSASFRHFSPLIVVRESREAHGRRALRLFTQQWYLARTTSQSPEGAFLAIASPWCRVGVRCFDECDRGHFDGSTHEAERIFAGVKWPELRKIATNLELRQPRSTAKPYPPRCLSAIICFL